MAKISYKQRVCETCGGRLEYDREAQEFVCLYCGNRYEKAESYDGQFSVRHAAMQALRSIVKGDGRMLEENLNDCQKIDPDYPGTVVARMAANLFRADEAREAGDQLAFRNRSMAAIELYRRLPADFNEIDCEAEADFYEHLDSDDVRSLLISDFRMLKDEARASFVDGRFDPSHVHGDITMTVAREMADGDWDSVDALLAAQGTYDADEVLERVVTLYPDRAAKAVNVASVLERGVDGERTRRLLTGYLANSGDAPATKTAIVSLLGGKGVKPSAETVVGLFRRRDGGSDHDEDDLVLALCELGLNNDDVNVVLHEAFATVDPELLVAIVSAIARNSDYVDFSTEDLKALLSRTDLGPEEKASVLAKARELGLTDRKRQVLFGFTLQSDLPAKEKTALLSVLADGLKGINPTLVERYLMGDASDGEGKAEVIEAIIGLMEGQGSLARAAQRYANGSSDPVEVRRAVCAVLSGHGLVKSVEHLEAFMGGGDYARGLAGQLRSSGLSVGPTVLGDYLERTLGTPAYDSRAFDELHTDESIVTKALFRRFVLEAPDDVRKADQVRLLARALVEEPGAIVVKLDTPSGPYEGPLLYGYLLATGDGPSTVQAVGQLLLETTHQPGAPVMLGGRQRRFRWFASSHGAKLSDAARAFCTAARLI